VGGRRTSDSEAAVVVTGEGTARHSSPLAYTTLGLEGAEGAPLSGSLGGSFRSKSLIRQVFHPCFPSLGITIAHHPGAGGPIEGHAVDAMAATGFRWICCTVGELAAPAGMLEVRQLTMVGAWVVHRRISLLERARIGSHSSIPALDEENHAEAAAIPEEIDGANPPIQSSYIS